MQKGLGLFPPTTEWYIKGWNYSVDVDLVQIWLHDNFLLISMCIPCGNTNDYISNTCLLFVTNYKLKQFQINIDK